ncbi:MAG: transglutaminase domain-containing protein [Ignavibacteria bacterium]
MQSSSFLSLLTFSLILFSAQEYSFSKPLKKIIIDSTNNVALSDRHYYLSIPSAYNKKQVQMLKEFIQQRFKPKMQSDIQAFGEILSWVNSRWDHDGSMSPANMSSMEILEAAEQGRNFSCNEYANVFTDIMHSLGFVCRTIGVATSDIAYGGMGVSHSLCEAWSNDLNKWILIDPQFGLLIKQGNQYVNFAELQVLLSKKLDKSIQFEHFDTRKKTTKEREQLRTEYLEFIKQYNAYIMFDARLSGKDILHVLPMGSYPQFLTSQGGNTRPLIFLSTINDAYFSLNRTHMLFDFNIPSGDAGSVAAIDSNLTQELFMEKMAETASIPDFTISFSNNMPWFSHYEMRFNEDDLWKKISGNTMKLLLRNGKNSIEVRSINQAGIAGPITFMKVRYQ